MKILIIEDDERLAKMLKTALEKEGYAVDYMTTGEKGERRLEVHHQDYNLLILDLMLPDKDGLDICRNVRAKNIDIPILVLSGKTDIKDKVSLLDTGADDYMVKPFSSEELMARVRMLVRRPPAIPSQKLEVDDLTMDLISRKVCYKKKELKLSLKEFRLLEYLMWHPNQVIGRDQLIDNIWDFDFDSFSNVVDVHMKNLRKKIGKKNAVNLLETVRGVGYRLNA
ncbi:MAG: response regulator transcription factor [Syntrophales bacterium]|nr:response regulator transcription factor [Syntrophales bacterium]